MSGLRVLLKLSGEVLSGEGKKGYNAEIAKHVVREISSLINHGIEVGVVIGAGNLLRGKELTDISRVMADHMGMLATVMNGIYLKELLEKYGMSSIVVTNIVNLPSVMDLKYDDVNSFLKKRHIVIFAGGTSNPLFTTDSAAALRASEINADILLKATKVDGVYDKDPKKFPDARKFNKITFDEAINLNLKIMDLEAFTLCKKMGISIVVYNFFENNASLKAINGESGTKIVP